MIHYHGTPLTPMSELEKMAGKHFCVSYARPDNAKWCIKNAQSIMWDNGAFTAFTQGKKFDPLQFQTWVETRLQHPHWAVIPDVIDGDITQQRDLLGKWTLRKELSAPVWHMGLPIDWLLELADRYPKICFGSSGQYWQVGSSDWCLRADEAFNALERQGCRPWIHLLRGMRVAGKRWPFASVDSANVARNFKNKGNTKCPEEMSRDLDSRQSPTTWEIESPHLGSFQTVCEKQWSNVR